MSKTVLKYPGSKWNISAQLAELVPEHHSYVEPYFGSGALFFTKPPSNIETVNDIDSDVVNLFRCIREDPERLARAIMTTPYSREEYESQFAIPDGAVCIDRYQRATGFLVRCWQGHGYRTTGHKVGWKNDVQGREKMYSLQDWLHLPERVIEVAERLRAVQIENRPALEVINRFDYENVFMYIDPPYMLSTRHGKQYRHEMDDNEHMELLAAVLRSKAKIMVSGYSHVMYNNLLKDWHRKELRSHAESGRPRTEVIWMNYEAGQMRMKI